MLLVAVVLTGMGGLGLTQLKLGGSSFSSFFQHFFPFFLWGLACAFGYVWGSVGMQEYDTPALQRDLYRVVVMEPPVEKAKSVSVTVLPEGGRHKWLLYLPKDTAAPVTGDFLWVDTHPQAPRQFTPDFDYATYLKTKGITHTGYVRGWMPAEPFPLSWQRTLQVNTMQMRHALLSRLDGFLTESDLRALVHAMLLGDKTDLTPLQKDAYTAAGLSHLLALSGMHLGFILVLLNLLTGWCKPWLRKVLVLGGLWSFIVLTGLPVSAVRAGCMLTLFLLTPWKGERTMGMDRWALAGMALLLFKPVWLLDAGFQLSFAAVAGILLLQPYAQECKHVPKWLSVPEWLHIPGWLHILEWLLNGVSICLFAQVAVLPLSLWHFGTFPLYFLFTNVLVSLVLAPLFIYLSIGVLVLGSVPVVGNWLCLCLSYTHHLQQGIISFISSLPGSQLQFEHVHAGAVVCAYLCFWFFFRYRQTRKATTLMQLQVSVIALLCCLIFSF